MTASNSLFASSRTWLALNYPWLILGATLLSFAVGDIYRHIFSLLALAGLYQAVHYRRDILHTPRLRLLGLLFLALWVPIVASLPDAVDMDRAASAALRYLTYFLAGIAVLRFPWDTRAAHRLLMSVLAVMLFWSLDALIQFFTGADIFGYAVFPGGRLTGMFHDSPRLGFVLAILTPLYFDAVRHLSARHRYAWLLLLPLIATILLGGSRSSWFILLVSGIFYLYYLRRSATRPLPWKRWAVPGLAVGALALALLAHVGWLSERAEQISGLFSGSYERANQATSDRLPLWRAAGQLASEHWINGVGVRNYAHVYAEENALGDDSVFADNRGHPHLFVLEIAAECGIIGIAGYALFIAWLLRKILIAPTRLSAPWGIAAFLAAFPLSSTLAFYAPFCASLIWLLVITWLALYPPAVVDPQG